MPTMTPSEYKGMSRWLGALLLVASASVEGVRFVGVSRRQCLSALPAAAALAAPWRVLADDGDDKLAASLIDARAQLAACEDGLASGAPDWDAVRNAVKSVTTRLTLKGYLGESVKSRAAALSESDAAPILADRSALLRSLGSLDNGAYKQQQAFFSKPSPEQLTFLRADLSESERYLDSLIANLAKK